MGRSRPAVLPLLTLLVLVGGMVGTGSARAAAPPPPLDACLRAGSFRIEDAVCANYRPGLGPQYGPISGITVLTVPRGQTVTMGIPGGDDVTWGPPPGATCGQFGCISYTSMWRGTLGQFGVIPVSGCGPNDASCTLSLSPGFVGDRDERYLAVFGQVYLGRSPTDQSHMWALYSPPAIYPVTLSPVDTGGTRLALGLDKIAYAVHEGADPVAASCADVFWYASVLSLPVPPVPGCVMLQRGGRIDSLEGTFEGWLPVDSGDWTIVADPRGDPGAPLLSRPSPYRSLTVRPVGDDIAAPVVAERRPDLAIDVVPREGSIELGGTQVVDVTVSAAGGEGGSLASVVFDDPDVLVQGSDDPPLRVVGVDPAVPAAGFPLAIGESRTFAVTVQAVALGSDSLGASASATDDLGDPRAAAQRGATILVEPGPMGGPGAPEPPVVVRALAGEAGSQGSLEGTVEGAPGTSVTVTMAAAPAGGDGGCPERLEGEDVWDLGSTGVDIGEDGVGRFTIESADLQVGLVAYGVTVAPEGVSAVGPCTPVSEATPTVSILDAEATEGTARKGVTAVNVELVLSSPPLGPVSVRVSTRDGTAQAPGDYTAIDGHEVSFAAGQTSTTVTLDVVPDADHEEDETILLELSDPSGATIGTGSATVTIVDDDGPGGGGEAIDPRGTWVLDSPDPAAKISLKVDDFDPATGAWSGRLIYVMDPYAGWDCWKGRTCTIPAKGTLKGDRFTLSATLGGPTLRLTGDLVRKRGTLTTLLKGTDMFGKKGQIRMTRREAAP